MTPALGLLPQQSAASPSCGCCLKRLTHAFTCRSAIQQTIKGDDLDVVVALFRPPPYTSLDSASHHQMLHCRHAIISGRRQRIIRALEYGASWQNEFNGSVAHIITDREYDYSQLLKYLKPKELSVNYPRASVQMW